MNSEYGKKSQQELKDIARMQKPLSRMEIIGMYSEILNRLDAVRTDQAEEKKQETESIGLQVGKTIEIISERLSQMEIDLKSRLRKMTLISKIPSGVILILSVLSLLCR